ncbi:MAG: hypothetical protein LBN10_10210 [Propionibacteriaceae bacterium]|jgi:hypothetical protein|nr:hypothetical protein [Propionibacteriaceae bacterium]
MTVQAGIREFRAGLADFIESEQPVEVTRHGQMVGIFLPTRRDRPFSAESFLASGDALDQQLAKSGVDTEELVRDFDKVRRERP